MIAELPPARSRPPAQIIPPSLVLIILADQLGRSVGDMYKGALVPGLLLVAAYAAYIIVMSFLYPKTVPALPPEARSLRGWKLVRKVITSLVPPLVLIFLVLGTIFIGLATPTEGGAMGAVGALALAAMNRRLNLEITKSALYATVKLSSFVIFILLGARVFSLTFYGVNGHIWVEHLMTSVPGGEVGFLIVANLLVFFLAFFLDYFELAFIIVPLLAPVADSLGIDLIWFGVMLAINMQTSFMHPPFGFSLFYLRSVAPTRAYKDRITGATIQPVTSGQIYMGALPFLFIQLAMVAIVIIFPGLVTHYKGTAAAVDPNSIQINVPMPGVDGANPFGTPSAPFGAPNDGTTPSFGSPPPSFGVPAQAPAQSEPAAPGFGSPTPSFGSPSTSEGTKP